MSDRELVEELAAAIWEGEKTQAPHLYEATYADENSTYRRVTEAAIKHAMDSPAMRDLLAEAKADALRDLADQWDLTWNRGHDRSVHPYSDDLRAAANPYRETTTGGDA